MSNRTTLISLSGFPILILLALAVYHAEVANASLSSHHNRAPAAFASSPSSLTVSKRNHVCRSRDNRLLSSIFSSSRDEGDAENDEQIDNWRSRLAGRSSFAQYGRPQDITSSSFGPLLPIAEAIDKATGGWGLSYADLSPATPRTIVGQAFLATNLLYGAAGLGLGWNGDWFYGGLIELAGIVSFAYHYFQLELGKNRSEVRLALLIDYLAAGTTLLTGGAYMVQAGITMVPLDTLLAAGAAVVCLSLCWVWEIGYPYIFWHSLWHILSAYTGFLVGQDHLSKIAGQ